jgi:hypothetical protein
MHSRARTLHLLAALAICLGGPGLAQAGPALYTGSVQLRMWGLDVPYGASLSGASLRNAPSGDGVSLAGSGPAAFQIPSAQLTLQTSLVDPSPPLASWDYRRTTFSAANDAGSFFGGGAPGSVGSAPVPSIPASQLNVSFSGGPDRFGGVMKLLGRYDWRGELASCSYCPYRTAIPLSPIGGPFGGTAMATTYIGGTAFPPTLVTATVWGFPWDTGTVAGVANVAGTSSPTTTSAMGSDLRTPSGLGTLQLVTPFLIRIKSRPPDCGGCENRWFYAGSARMELHFVPEPAAAALLAAGLGALALLYYGSSRRKP